MQGVKSDAIFSGIRLVSLAFFLILLIELKKNYE